jgi:hypothetical protein
MRVLLLSTYELGHQPLGIAGPAAAFEAAGHATRGVDLAIAGISDETLHWADAVAISIPMHTATRLALEAISAVRSRRPAIPVAWHGLYAPVLADRGERSVRSGPFAIRLTATLTKHQGLKGAFSSSWGRLARSGHPARRCGGICHR